MISALACVFLFSSSPAYADPEPPTPGPTKEQMVKDSPKADEHSHKKGAGKKSNKPGKTNPKGLQVEPVDFKMEGSDKSKAKEKTDPKGLQVEPVDF